MIIDPQQRCRIACTGVQCSFKRNTCLFNEHLQAAVHAQRTAGQLACQCEAGSSFERDHDLISSELQFRSCGESFGIQGIRHHDHPVFPLHFKQYPERSEAAVMPVCDHFTETVIHGECCIDHTATAVRKAAHPVVYMRERAGAVGSCKQRHISVGPGMSLGDDDPVFRTMPGKLEADIVFTGHRHDLQKTAGVFPELLQFIDIRLAYIFFRLGSFVFHIKVWTFQMYSEHPGPFISLPVDFRCVLQGSGKNVMTLRDRRRTDPGHPFCSDLFEPCPQTFLIGIIQVKPFVSMGMDVNESGNDPCVSVINIRFFFSIVMDGCDRCSGRFDHCRDKSSLDPYSAALYDHMRSPFPNSSSCFVA